MPDLFAPFAQHAAAVGVCHAAFRAAELRHVDLDALAAPYLDFGCGDGRLAAAWLEGRVDLGVDLRWPPLKQARQSGCYTAVVRADGACLPLADNCLGSIISISVCEHLSQPAAVLAELYRVLRPGGCLVATITLANLHQHLYWPRLAQRCGLPWIGKLYTRFQDRLFGHCSLHDETTWRHWLHTAGFELPTCRAIVSPRMVAAWDRQLPWAAFLRLFSGMLRPRVAAARRAWRQWKPLVTDDTAPGSVLYVVAIKPVAQQPAGE